MLKTTGLLLLPLLAGAALAAPQVDNVAVSHTRGKAVYITYELNERAIVTLDVLTNGVSIGEANFTRLSGAVNRIVDPETDTLKIKWDQRRDWPGEMLENVKFTLRAWSTNTPPDYLVYDFVNHATNFYVSAEALPDGGLKNDVYKKDRIVLRKIPAKNVEWVMGAADFMVSANEKSPAHTVILNEDYYMAIYETTQAQYRHLVQESDRESQTYVGDDADVHPADSIRYWMIRGSTAWPSLGRNDTGTIMATIRKKTGIGFDLPTEAQWEFACRAGVKSELYSGKNIAKDGNDAAVSEIAWTKYNTTTSQAVGLKPDNEWGLYDMLGNINEWCCDYYDALGCGDAIDPVGAPEDSGVGRVLRGGGFGWSEARGCASASRGYDNGKGKMKDRGFRLICPVTLKW
ncbi:MAG: SUMF1/EgtB/PvdO family nonheme iron enzyme [Kiritimatiellae bacterium]|nr:SUMF1/EgtB/PvdO family nonheme iron enzyme [Kiritimatiellia bacterium]